MKKSDGGCRNTLFAIFCPPKNQCFSRFSAVCGPIFKTRARISNRRISAKHKMWKKWEILGVKLQKWCSKETEIWYDCNYSCKIGAKRSLWGCFMQAQEAKIIDNSTGGHFEYYKPHGRSKSLHRADLSKDLNIPIMPQLYRSRSQN